MTVGLLQLQCRPQADETDWAQLRTARVGDSPFINFENTQCDVTQALRLILNFNFEKFTEDFVEQKWEKT